MRKYVYSLYACFADKQFNLSNRRMIFSTFKCEKSRDFLVQQSTKCVLSHTRAHSSTVHSQAAPTHLKAFLQNNEASQLFSYVKQPNHDVSKLHTHCGHAAISALGKEQTRDSCLMVGGRCSLNFLFPEVLVLQTV